MKEMEYLTEKDIEYFRNKADNGEAILIELDPDVLLHLNLSELMQPDRKAAISEDELKSWLEENHAFLSKVYTENMQLAEETNRILSEQDRAVQEPTRGQTVMQGLPSALSNINLTDEQWKVIRWAINETNMTDKQIQAILRKDLSPEMMKKMCDIFINMK